MPTVAYQGTDGSWSELAALRLAGRHFDGVHAGVRLLPATDIAGVVAALLGGEASYGVFALSNSVGGPVSGAQEALALLGTRGAVLLDSLVLAVSHDLAGPVSDEPLVRVYGHEQALRQCAGWLDANLPVARRVAVADGVVRAREGLADGEAVLLPSRALPTLVRLATDVGPHPNDTVFAFVRRT